MERKYFAIGLFFMLLIVAVFDMQLSRAEKAEQAWKLKYETSQDSLMKRIETMESKWKAIDEVSKNIGILSPKVKEKSKLKLAFYIIYYGEKYPLVNNEVLNIMTSIPAVESTYYKYAIGSVGERGYYQIHPVHLKQFNKKTIHLAFGEQFQVKEAYRILMEQVEKYDRIAKALNGYNGWASLRNPYYGKIQRKVNMITNI